MMYWVLYIHAHCLDNAWQWWPFFQRPKPTTRGQLMEIDVSPFCGIPKNQLTFQIGHKQ